MGLYERLLGRDDAGDSVEGKIRIHGFNALLAEVARGQLTPAQANARIPQISRGLALQPGAEQTEATTLLNSITSLAANNRLPRAKLIEDVLTLAEVGVTGYSTPTEVKQRLGV